MDGHNRKCGSSSSSTRTTRFEIPFRFLFRFLRHSHKNKKIDSGLTSTRLVVLSVSCSIWARFDARNEESTNRSPSIDVFLCGVEGRLLLLRGGDHSHGRDREFGLGALVCIGFHQYDLRASMWIRFHFHTTLWIKTSSWKDDF